MGFVLTPEQKLLASAAIGVLTIFVPLQSPEFANQFATLLRKATRRQGAGIQVGRTFIPDQARLRHSHIVGATGTGKTVLLEKLLFADLKRGSGAIVIDPKGERAFYESVRDYCCEIGREKDLMLLSASHPEDSSVWNPCALGSPSELQTKFYNSAIYSEPHYAKACEYALGEAFTSLTKEGHPITLAHVSEELDRLAKGNHKDAFQGLYYDLQALLRSEWRDIMVPSTEAQRATISLLDVITTNKILFVDLPTEGKRVQSSRIGRLLTQEIILISGMRKRDPSLKGARPFSIYIDEFDAFATESFSTFLNKGRSSDFMIHLAHQTLSDLNVINPNFAGQILGNCNVRFIFRQDDPDDAERWSRFLGTRTVVKSTYRTQSGQSTGDSSNREAQEFVIPPDTIKSLPVGRCVFSMKTEGICRQLRIPFKRRTPPPFRAPVLPQIAQQVSRPAEVVAAVTANKTQPEGDRKWNDLNFTPASQYS